MKFYSTKNRSQSVSLREAVLSGMPADNGLYMPERIPILPNSFFDSLNRMSYRELSFEVAKRFVQEDVPTNILRDIIDEALTFDTPLVALADPIRCLELFHGPTLAFKDVGARFMSRLMAFFMRNSERKLNIVVATSGDTGSAVANGFYQVPGIDVIVLYPAGKISRIQEKQIATLGGNITALKINGTFDDCQRLAKAALIDPYIQKTRLFSSANSINISRLIPQSFYYFNAFRQIEGFRKYRIAICVPSGNFGNLTAGVIAGKMGLPVQRFIAATNINRVVPDYLRTGQYRPRKSIQTISNAMDVGDPSNFVRILELYHSDWQAIGKDIWGSFHSDDETRAIIKTVWQQSGYLLDPHGAVGYLGLQKYLQESRDTDLGIFLETAHPAKFKDIVESLVQKTVEVPERLAKFLNRPVTSQSLSSQYADFKEFLINKPD
jgi:threonine synthase